MDRLDRILAKIQSLQLPFEPIGRRFYSMNGIKTETIQFKYGDAEFVFVEGKRDVTLGWNVETCKLGERILKMLQEYYEWDHEDYSESLKEMKEDYKSQIAVARQCGDQQKAEQLEEELENEVEWLKEEAYNTFDEFLCAWNLYLQECLSPERKADIGSMLVEVNSRYLEKTQTYDAFIHELKRTPFCLATEDEWEYLVNGGRRTLFRWGDFLTEREIHEMFQVGCAGVQSKQTHLETPNMFGLQICYNSYRYELIDDRRFVKGGDGGGSLCGGEGLIHVVPCYTAFYRQRLKQKEPLPSAYYSYRRILRLSE